MSFFYRAIDTSRLEVAEGDLWGIERVLTEWFSGSDEAETVIQDLIEALRTGSKKSHLEDILHISVERIET